MLLMDINFTDIFVLIGGAVTGLSALFGATWAILKRVEASFRSIAKSEQVELNSKMNDFLEGQQYQTAQLKSLSLDMGSLNTDVANLKGWTAGFSAGAQARYFHNTEERPL